LISRTGNLIRPGGEHLAHQLVGIAGRDNDLVAGMTEQAAQPLPEQGLVLGQRYSHGTIIRTTVPAPGA